MPTRRIAQISLTEPITLAQAKAQVRSDCADDDAQLTALITVARMAAEDRLGRTLVRTHWRLTQDRFTPAIVLINPPVFEVQSVKYFTTAGAQRVMSSADWYLDSVSEPGYLVPAAGRAWPETMTHINAVEVDYVAGYADNAVPAPIKQWMLLAIADMYTYRERSADKPAVPQNFADALLDTYRIWGL